MSNVARLPDSPDFDTSRQQVEKDDDVKAEQASLLALVSDVLEANSPNTSLDALAGAVEHHLGCRQVSVALAEQDTLVLRAISKQAFVDTSSSESALIVDAMQEACDREAVVRWPIADSAGSSELGVLVAHRALAGRRRSISYCSIPIYHEHELIGAMLLERQDGFVFTEKQAIFLEKIATLAAPLLALRLQADRTIFAVCRQRFQTTMTTQLGTDRPGRRVLVGMACLFMLGAFVIPVDATISASAELVPLERRLITAPRAGFVQSVDVVAGQQVKPGQLLATLDARDLEVEAARSISEIATAEVEFRAAMASFDRQASAVARARLAQLRAQQQLVERQLNQNSLEAPIAGLILNSNPGNTLGAPVSRGDTLFEIAPADSFEIHLLVDESEIRNVYIGQTGELSLRARPGEVMEFSVQTVHPIAESGNGSSRFRIRANLSDHVDDTVTVLRPGESGQAHLHDGTKNFISLLLSPLYQRLIELKWRLIG